MWSYEKTLVVEIDGDAIRAVVENIHFKDDIGVCRCTGDPTLEFFRGFELVAMMAVHHGLCLSADRWVNSGWLMPESSDYLCNWLMRIGVGGPLEQLLQQREEEKKRQK